MIRGSTSKSKKKTQQKTSKENVDKKSNIAVSNKKVKNTNVMIATKSAEVVPQKNDTIKDKRQLSPIQTRQPDPDILPKKMERSHSFFLTRKLSKIYNSITGSKESLTKIPENDESSSGFKFTRSKTMASIPLRKSIRRAFGESKLEKLHEEHVPDKLDKDVESEPRLSPSQLRHSPTNLRSRDSFRERSSSFINSIKRTFSNSGSPEKYDKTMNPRWSASLANLQHIDVMVSYENLSFINYDKFNTYEKQLEKIQSPDTEAGSKRFSVDARIMLDQCQLKYMEVPPISPSIPDVPTTVRYRHQRKARTTAENSLFADFDSNFDQPRNLYRQSLDDRKLKCLNKVNRDSFRFSNYLDRAAEDVLMLDNYSFSKPNSDTMEDCVDSMATSGSGKNSSDVKLSESVSSNSVGVDRKSSRDNTIMSMLDLYDCKKRHTITNAEADLVS